MRKSKSSENEGFLNHKWLVLKSENQIDFIEILISEEIPNKIQSELLYLVVEESMTTEVNSQEFTLPAGSYFTIQV